jgi:hypothetical protein
MSKAYVTSLSISNYGGRNPSGSFQFQFDGGSTHYTLDKEDAEKIFAVLHEIVERKREVIAQALMNIETPPLLGYDRNKTIEAEGEAPSVEIPF